jgi:hypothetical protein
VFCDLDDDDNVPESPSRLGAEYQLCSAELITGKGKTQFSQNTSEAAGTAAESATSNLFAAASTCYP